jgi:hypothetical protein
MTPTNRTWVKKLADIAKYIAEPPTQLSLTPCGVLTVSTAIEPVTNNDTRSDPYYEHLFRNCPYPTPTCNLLASTGHFLYSLYPVAFLKTKISHFVIPAKAGIQLFKSGFRLKAGMT